MRVTLKLATSLDGKIAVASGASRWITGVEARRQVHLLRAMHAAILVGVETVIADDPELTVRVAGYVGRQPCRVVLDSRQRMPADARLVKTAGSTRTIVASIQAPGKRLASAGVEVIEVAARDGRVDPLAVLAALDDLGLSPVMIEGGAQVAASFIDAGLIDALEWFRAPIVLGDEGLSCVAPFVLKQLRRAPRFTRRSVEPVGDDLWERYERV